MTSLVSVIIPTYRCAGTIEQSVRSALSQTVSDIEVVAVDDMSDDGTADILHAIEKQDPRLKVIELTEPGDAASTRNCAVRAAKADWIAFLDSDDLWEPDKLARELAAAKETGASFVYTAAACMDETGAPTGKVFSVPDSVTAKKLLYGNDVITSTVLVKRALYETHPMERGDLHEDLICWYHLLKTGAKTAGINEPLVRYRVSKNSKSGNKRKSAVMAWKTYRHLGIGFFPRIACFLGYCLHGIRRYWL